MQKVNLRFDAIRIGDTASKQFEITSDLLDRYIDITMTALYILVMRPKMQGLRDELCLEHLSQVFFSIDCTKLPGHNALLLEIQCKFHSPAIVGDFIFVKVSVKDKHESVECVSLDLTASQANGQKISSGKALVKVRRL